MRVNELFEVSLGDYVRKANMSRAQNQLGAAFAPDAEQRAQAAATVQRRQRGLAMAKTRTDRLQAQNRAAVDQARAAALAADRDNLPHLQAELKKLQSRFDPNFEYSDDYSFWRQQKDLQGQIQTLQNRIHAAQA